METPVALIVFNRPKATHCVFSAIAAARPTRLFLIADGPRSGRLNERALCEDVRRIVSAVDWPCKVETNFSAQNLGCRRRLISGLDWVFSMVEEAIILEDDCLPDSSFFPYCAELLERFRDRSEIGIISGHNPLEKNFPFPYSYCFTKMVSVWGWATWRRTWKRYDEHLNEWPRRKDDVLGRVWSQERHRRFWATILDSMYQGTGPDTWDYQLVFRSWVEQWLNVIPNRNLIENIGIGVDATHTKRGDAVLTPPARSLSFPLSHPPDLVEWAQHPKLLQERIYAPDLLRRARRQMRRLLRID